MAIKMISRQGNGAFRTTIANPNDWNFFGRIHSRFSGRIGGQKPIGNRTFCIRTGGKEMVGVWCQLPPWVCAWMTCSAWRFP